MIYTTVVLQLLVIMLIRDFQHFILIRLHILVPPRGDIKSPKYYNSPYKLLCTLGLKEKVLNKYAQCHCFKKLLIGGPGIQLWGSVRHFHKMLALFEA